MTKFQMHGFPLHRTGVQDKSLTNPLKFVGKPMIAGTEDYSEFDPLNPFKNNEWGGVFTAKPTGDVTRSKRKEIKQVQKDTGFSRSDARSFVNNKPQSGTQNQQFINAGGGMRPSF